MQLNPTPFPLYPRPEALGKAMPWPPSFPLGAVFRTALADHKLTAAEQKLLNDARQTISNCRAELAALDPETIKSETRRLVRRANDGDPNISLRAVQAQAKRLEGAELLLDATREVVEPIIHVAELSLAPVAGRVLDRVEATFGAFVAELEKLQAKKFALFEEQDDQDFHAARVQQTRADLAKLHADAESGRALTMLVDWGLAPAELPEPKPEP